MRNLAKQILTAEAVSKHATDAKVHEAVRVCEKLRISLSQLAGSDGFTALLRRSLDLARADISGLESVIINPEGALEGLEDLAEESTRIGKEVGIVLTSHLLTLLATFIGKRLTLQIVRETWPEESFDEYSRGELMP